ncbi:leucine-rich repeat-containing protein 15-like [Zophobas morio]|uniref:leucine-rich repeat-containing protein 15-like n=1 Tax=Zophobas morio TaxID=2755281 RepID=UPI003083DBAD
MRIHPLCLLLVVAVPALVTTATQTSCISGCKCDVLYTRNLKIRDCDSPLILTKITLSDLPKETPVISFTNVKITHIEDDAFTGFDEVKTVVFEDASIESIRPKAFELLPELTSLTFLRTKFAEKPNLSSPYLEELTINDCNLSEVPNLDNMPNLRLLNLADNLIKTIDKGTFSKSINLENLSLINNSITELPQSLFVENPNFIVLYLDHNPLTSLDLLFEPKLEILSLKHCKLTTLDRHTTQNLSVLNTLYLSGNEISVLPLDVFEPMKYLNNLDLSNNKVVELDDDIFLENYELDSLVLDNNQFERLPKFRSKESIFHIRTFSCKNCGLKSVKGSFEDMDQLVTLDLSNNKLNDIDGVFTEMSNIKEIILSNNEITSVGVNSFGNNSELETLDLSNNPLLPLNPEVFKALPSLKTLNVSNCGLNLLWANHKAVFPSLEQLFVDNNQLNQLTADDMKIIPKYKSIDVQGNPLQCPDFYKLIEYLTGNLMYPKDTQMKTHEDLQLDAEVMYKTEPKWGKIILSDCPLPDDDEEITDNDDVDYEDEDEIDENSAFYDTENGEDDGVEASVLTTNSLNLAKASYILSITSVFILTALLVLFVAVVITLLILKRNKAFNVRGGNLPRLKIPLWHTTPGQKKHSGSIYRPLSEELSGPRTPVINRYEFKQTPSVHNTLP